MLPKVALDVRRIDTGRPLIEHIAECGGDPGAMRDGGGLDPRRIKPPIELHIEQAPTLVEAGKPIGDRHLYSWQFSLSSHSYQWPPRSRGYAAPLSS